MCGIAGMFERGGHAKVHEADLRRMLAMLRHRGPDEFGILLDQEVGLGSARLSIIDLSGGSQPIANEDENLWIVFNGEIFNYIELRAELEQDGHTFRTSSDTEVILHMYEQHGPEALQRLNGQFAIAIWDRSRRRLFLARDRLGIRPLFYSSSSQGTLLFGSEIKSLLADPRLSAELDKDSIERVFTFWAPLPGQTIFRNVVELPPGHYLVADKNSIHVQRFWRTDYPSAMEARKRELQPGAFEAALEEFQSLLLDSCRVRLRADVPVGAYLSGGLDSSTIAAMVRRHMSNRLVTFSIAFSDRQYDESAFQQQMAKHLGTDHHVVRATHEDIGKVFPDVVWHAEAPLFRTAPAPMFLLSGLVRRQNFKVVLTGEGADEFLAGYDIFKEAKIRAFWARDPVSKIRPLLLQKLYPDIASLSQTNPAFLAAFFAENLQQTGLPWYSHMLRWRNGQRSRRFFADNAERISFETEMARVTERLPAGFTDWEPLARAQYLESTYFLSQYLLSSQGDRMAMAHSVEGRFPFLDYRVVEFCNRLPARFKLRGLNEKWLLKKAAESLVPQEILRRPKRPYREPIHRSFFNSQTPEYVRAVLSPGALQEAGIFKAAPVQQLIRKVDAGAKLSENDDMALVGIISTQLLHERFIRNFDRAQPLGENDRIKVCDLAQSPVTCS